MSLPSIPGLKALSLCSHLCLAGKGILVHLWSSHASGGFLLGDTAVSERPQTGLVDNQGPQRTTRLPFNPHLFLTPPVQEPSGAEQDTEPDKGVHDP